MDNLTIIGIGILVLISIVFIIMQMHLREINVKNQQNMNGISHVWGMLMEIKLDLQMLDNKFIIPNIYEGKEAIEEIEEE